MAFPVPLPSAPPPSVMLPPPLLITVPACNWMLPAPLASLSEFNTTLIALLPPPTSLVSAEVLKTMLSLACNVKVAAAAPCLKRLFVTVMVPLPRAARVTSPVAVMPATPPFTFAAATE